MMTPKEALEFTLSKVDELKNKLNIEVEIKSDLICKKNKKLIKKHKNREDRSQRISPKDWVVVNFFITTKSQSDIIYEMLRYLLLCGIEFDTSGCSTQRSWELDWAFKYTGKENPERLDAVATLQDLFNEVEEGGEGTLICPTDDNDEWIINPKFPINSN